MDELTKAANMAARIMTQELKRQSPRKTGALSKSIKVQVRVTDDKVTYVTDHLRYGIYLDRGTGPYYTKVKAEWNPKPGKGKGGIKPRHWKTISSTARKTMTDLILKALRDITRATIKQSFRTKR
jgi:hypothetical protein